jgi:hypothetical protein
MTKERGSNMKEKFMKTAATTRKTEAQAPNPYGDSEAFGRDLIRRVLEITESWRRCPVAKCRRLRRCAGAPIACVKPSKELTPEEESRMQAELRDGLKRRQAELDRQKA